ncbi:unnamed protein product, partial [Amoebophrya sp. A25]|eukprot:GSA25T00004469001.1
MKKATNTSTVATSSTGGNASSKPKPRGKRNIFLPAGRAAPIAKSNAEAKTNWNEGSASAVSAPQGEGAGEVQSAHHSKQAAFPETAEEKAERIEREEEELAKRKLKYDWMDLDDDLEDAAAQSSDLHLLVEDPELADENQNIAMNKKEKQGLLPKGDVRREQEPKGLFQFNEKTTPISTGAKADMVVDDMETGEEHEDIEGQAAAKKARTRVNRSVIH